MTPTIHVSAAKRLKEWLAIASGGLYSIEPVSGSDSFECHVSQTKGAEFRGVRPSGQDILEFDRALTNAMGVQTGGGGR
jgi:hypothetical protein